MSRRPAVLIVEDDPPIRRGLIDLFVFHGFEVSSAEEGLTVAEKIREHSPDLVILDVMLPGKDGFAVLDEIRTFSRELPVIMLTARSTDEDIILGLTLGADDYVTKPFSVQELVLRS